MNSNNRPGIDPVAGESRAWLDEYAPNVKQVIDSPAIQSLGEMSTRAAAQFGDRTAFSNLGGSLSFNEVDALATRFAAYLQHDLGMQRGDRIVLQMPNIMQYPVALYGSLKAGMIVVNANPLYTARELSAVVTDAEPKAIVVLANFGDKLEQVLPGTTIEHVIITKVADLLPQPKKALINFLAAKIKKMVPKFNIPGAVSFDDAMSADPAHFTDPEIGPDDVAFLQYTGGTTGGTKAAVLTHWNLLCNQDQFMGQLRYTLQDIDQTVAVAALPLYHVFALTVNALGLFSYGAHNVLITNPRDFDGFVKTLGQTKPHLLVLVSTLAGALLDRDAFRNQDHSNLKVVVAGGMALRSSVATRWTEVTGMHITEGYGLTEASPVVTVNPTHKEPRAGTIGVPLPSTDVKIVNDDLQTVEIGVAGELAVRGPQVMRGYWNQDEETAKVITKDGWLLTGDIASVDADGYLTIVDRKKEIIVVSGFNVYPGELEDVAMQHPAVAEAGAIGVEDEKTGEAPKLFVVRRDESLTAEALQEHLKQNLTRYKLPREIVFIDEMPKTNVGKVLRRALHDIPV